MSFRRRKVGIQTETSSDGGKGGAGTHAPAPFFQSNETGEYYESRNRRAIYPRAAAGSAEIEKSLVEDFGFPPMTREVAAAHEAGHVIVADAVGLPPILYTYIRKKRITGDQNTHIASLPKAIWTGWTAWGDSRQSVCAISPRTAATAALRRRRLGWRTRHQSGPPRQLCAGAGVIGFQSRSARA